MTAPITIYHSPDADDAFMFYGLAKGHVTHSSQSFILQFADVESLNHKARKGEADVTAASVHALAYLADDFAILNSGGSFGGIDYGPTLVSRNGIDWDKTPLLAIPGELTSAALALQIYLHDRGLKATLMPINFDKIEAVVATGEVHAGVIIHEGQLTHQTLGLKGEVNLGEWWWREYNTPLPLGVNIARKALGTETLRAIQETVKKSIAYGLSHRDDALSFASEFRRGLSRKDMDVFVGMYVNELTADMGHSGRTAIRKFLKRGHECGIVPQVENLLFI